MWIENNNFDASYSWNEKSRIIRTFGGSTWVQNKKKPYLKA